MMSRMKSSGSTTASEKLLKNSSNIRPPSGWKTCAEYQTAKDEATGIVSESGNDLERRQLREIVAREPAFVNSMIPKKLEAEIDNLRHVRFQILRRKPDFLIGWFQYLKEKREAFNDQSQAKNLIEAGKRHIEAEDWDELDKVIGRLLRLLPEDEGESNEARAFITNISRTS